MKFSLVILVVSLGGVNSYFGLVPAHFPGVRLPRQSHLACDKVHCENGGTCHNIIEYPFGPICMCEPGFSGDWCQVNMNECASLPCLEGGTCMDGTNNYTCICPSGFSGTNCETSDGPLSADPIFVLMTSLTLIALITTKTPFLKALPRGMALNVAVHSFRAMHTSLILVQRDGVACRLSPNSSILLFLGASYSLGLLAFHFSSLIFH